MTNDMINLPALVPDFLSRGGWPRRRV